LITENACQLVVLAYRSVIIQNKNRIIQWSLKWIIVLIGVLQMFRWIAGDEKAIGCTYNGLVFIKFSIEYAERTTIIPMMICKTICSIKKKVITFFHEFCLWPVSKADAEGLVTAPPQINHYFVEIGNSQDLLYHKI
jgi:hypothetical protein